MAASPWDAQSRHQLHQWRLATVPVRVRPAWVARADTDRSVTLAPKVNRSSRKDQRGIRGISCWSFCEFRSRGGCRSMLFCWMRQDDARRPKIATCRGEPRSRRESRGIGRLAKRGTPPQIDLGDGTGGRSIAARARHVRPPVHRAVTWSVMTGTPGSSFPRVASGGTPAGIPTTAATRQLPRRSIRAAPEGLGCGASVDSERRVPSHSGMTPSRLPRAVCRHRCRPTDQRERQGVRDRRAGELTRAHAVPALEAGTPWPDSRSPAGWFSRLHRETPDRGLPTRVSHPS